MRMVLDTPQDMLIGRPQSIPTGRFEASLGLERCAARVIQLAAVNAVLLRQFSLMSAPVGALLRLVNDRPGQGIQVLRRLSGHPGHLVPGGKGRGAGLPGPQRRGKVHDDEDYHGLSAAHFRARDGRRLRRGHRIGGGATPHRLPARDGAAVRRDVGARLPGLHGTAARDVRRLRAEAHGRRGGHLPAGRLPRLVHRQAVQGASGSAWGSPRPFCTSRTCW